MSPTELRDEWGPSPETYWLRTALAEDLLRFGSAHKVRAK